MSSERALSTIGRVSKRTTIEYRLLRSVIFALGRTSDLASSLAVVLRSVCETTGWAYGEAWIPESHGRRLVRGPVWTGTARRLAAFANASRRYSFHTGEGLPGRVWRSRTPLWIRDVRFDSNFPRARLASKVGLKGAFAIPVLGGDEVIAVLGFFVFEPRPEDNRLVELVTAVAAELGLVIQKMRAERALRHSEAFLKAQDLERRRVARELHDGVNQTLSSIAFRLKVLEGDFALRSKRLQQQASRAVDLLEHAMDEVRRITRDLAPSLLEEVGLVPGLRRLGRELSLRTGTSFRLERRRFPSSLPPEVEFNIFRIVQEALTNAEKHSGASRVSVRLWRNASRIGVGVRDNGKGFSLSRSSNGMSDRMGLTNIRERSRLIHGRLHLHSSPGRGTRIRLEIPLRPTARPGDRGS
jgi:signal transduction histidine kinase